MDDRQLVLNLMDLFAHIDVDGDGNLEWDEFTTYIVEQGMAREDGIDSHQIRKYLPSTVEDTAIRLSVIDKIQYFEELDKLAAIDQNAGVVKLYSPEFQLYKEISHPDAQFISTAHLSKYHMIAAASTDQHLNFYDVNNGFKIARSFRTPCTMIDICYSQKTGILFGAGFNGTVYCWDPELIMEHAVLDESAPFEEESKSTRWKQFEKKKGMIGHTDMVLSLLEIPTLDSIASGSVDATIRLWDIKTGTTRKELTGHVQGVRSLAYCTDYRFLVSAGFDYDALVFNPYVEKLNFRLHGHNAPLVSVQCPPGTTQIITADVQGFVKIWDIRTFACMQTLSQQESHQVKSMVFMPPHRRIVTAGYELIAYDYEKQTSPEFTDDAPIVSAIYNHTLSSFITCSGNSVKIWSAKSGQLARVYTNLSETELTALCLDDRERKFIVGDHSGKILVYDYHNGAFMKDLTSHSAEVTSLVYCEGDKLVLSSSWDSTLFVHDEKVRPDKMSEKRIVLRQVLNAHSLDITCMAYSRPLSLIASGSSDFVLQIWDYERCKLEFSLTGHCAEIICCTFLDPFPLLCSADYSGAICIWLVRPHPSAYRLVTSFKSMLTVEQVTSITSMATRYDDVLNRYYLFTGDDRGEIRTWDLTRILQELRLEPIQVKANKYRSVRRIVTVDLKQGSFEDGDASIQSNHRRVKHAQPVQSELLPNSVVRQIASWKAHTDTIRSLQLITEPLSLLSASNDRYAKVWSLDGEPFGTLRQGSEFAGSSWTFPLDVELQRETKLNAADKCLSTVKKMEVEALKPVKTPRSMGTANLQSFPTVETLKPEELVDDGYNVLQDLADLERMLRRKEDTPVTSKRNAPKVTSSGYGTTYVPPSKGRTPRR
eukprot:GILK01009703.1.p1 GENE.GILK01009703.1~~GILK01009703.1.p1  ORF type:complete len:1022 (-),score=193.31 GILK01009703.1:203-2842(-)